MTAAAAPIPIPLRLASANADSEVDADVDADAATELDVCVIIPCLNEELGVAGVVQDFKAVLPRARIVVIDNNSIDHTAERARAAGAEVITELRRGKAQAVLTALEHVSSDADVVIMIDGDGSYPAEGARLLLEQYQKQPADMITGIRTVEEGKGGGKEGKSKALKPLHVAGQRAFEAVLALAFDVDSKDLFSGLRLFSRRFCENVPILSRGFEVELELTIQCIDKGFHMSEVAVPFRERAAGSFSKLRTFHDGYRILRFLVVLLHNYRPVRFFGIVAGMFAVVGLSAGSLPVYEYFTTGKVLRFPLAFLAASVMVIAFFTFQTGIMLECSLRSSREAFQVRLRRSNEKAHPKHREHRKHRKHR